MVVTVNHGLSVRGSLLHVMSCNVVNWVRMIKVCMSRVISRMQIPVRKDGSFVAELEFWLVNTGLGEGS